MGKRGKPKARVPRAPVRNRFQVINAMLSQAQSRLQAGDHKGVIEDCLGLLEMLPAKSTLRADTLGCIAGAYTMLKRFAEAYAVLSEAVAITPKDPILWYNRSLASLYTSRFGQALRDVERAVSLNRDEAMDERFAEQLVFTGKVAEQNRALRGPGFTLDQLIEQQEAFALAMKARGAQRWVDAEQGFRHVIEMADCLPQPWGSLGNSLLMQHRFDEAEEALQRALSHDPEYELARSNLAKLGDIRTSGQLPRFGVTRPFSAAQIGLTVIRE